jgi:hypothetical protein
MIPTMTRLFTLDARLLGEYDGKTDEEFYERIDAEFSELEREATVVLDRPTERPYPPAILTHLTMCSPNLQRRIAP